MHIFFDFRDFGFSGTDEEVRDETDLGIFSLTETPGEVISRGVAEFFLISRTML